MFVFTQHIHPLAQTTTEETPPAKKRIGGGLVPVAMTMLFFLTGCGGSSDSSDAQPPATGRIVYMGKYNDLEGMLTMNPDGSGHKLVSSKFSRFLTSGVSFSPDGSKIVLVGNPDPDPTSRFDRGYNIWLTNADGSNLRALTDYNRNERSRFSAPSFSPDGSRVLFSRYTYSDEKNTYVILDMQEGTQTTILEGESYLYPSFAPDGSKIIVYRVAETESRDSVSSAFTVNEDGTGETLLIQDASDVSFSRDGRRITFRRGEEIYTSNADGTQQRRLTNNTAGDYSPSFSPDGTRIVFCSDRDQPSTGDVDSGYRSLVIVMNDDGTNQTTIPTDLQAKLVTEDRTSGAFDHVSSHAWTFAPAQ